MTEGEITGAMERLRIGREEAETHDYLGDGVYATHDGEQVWIRTLEGQSIALDRHALDALQSYRSEVRI